MYGENVTANDEINTNWHDKCVIEKQTVTLNETWTDYAYARYHPRTINLINEYQRGDVTKPFDLYPLGTALYNTIDFKENYVHKIRAYVEECDSFQGFHVLLDATDGFGGLSNRCMEHLGDDYERKSIMAVPLFEPRCIDGDEEDAVKDAIRTLNACLCFDGLRENSSLFVPMSTAKSCWGKRPREQLEFHRISYDVRFHAILNTLSFYFVKLTELVIN